MRIISGKFKGKKLNTFNLDTTRPTSDMMREALFDKIGYRIYDCVFLDLFSGTGAVGIEAVSRGASQVYFADKNIDAIKLIKKNLSLVKNDNTFVLNSDFKTTLNTLKNQQIVFDIIFLDPPYKTDFAEQSINLITNLNLLNEDGIIVWEHDNSKLNFISTNYPNITTKKYGEKYFTYLNKKDIV